MTLATGLRLGPYEVHSAIGAGGMGEVYRARDMKLGREVAIKVLPDAFAANPDRLARFEREAQVLAALNHPNIAHIHGLEESGGVLALVMELVEGETLAERLSHAGRVLSGPPKPGSTPMWSPGPTGPGLPLDEALGIARQIADALQAAHERGIVHRDLKPANIKVTPAGVVKVLDFGLAKAGGDSAVVDLTRSPTMVGPTAEGVLLGTAPYMSPEQARGKPVDKRTDIWAFGCVLYELLTGLRAFRGETTTDVLAAIVEREPDWGVLPGDTPPAVRRLLRRCLEKDPNERLHDVADARIEITEVRRGGAVAESPIPIPPGASRRRERMAWASTSAVSLLIAVVTAVWAIRPASVPPEMRFEITTPPTSDPTSLAISPDGQQIVFLATSEGRSRLWLRSFDSISPRPLAGTDGGFYPFWSPDSRSIAFFTGGQLARFDLDGGLVRVLASAPNPVGGAWSPNGTILFTPNFTGPIFRIPANGGEAAALTRTDARQASHRFPQFLPDGRHFLYYVPSAEARGVHVGDLAGPTSPRLLDADAQAAYASSRHLLFIRQGTLVAQSFDPVTLALSGNPFRIADQVVAVGDSSSAGLSVSAAGPIVYRVGLASGQRQFIWFDRSGKETGNVAEPDGTGPANPSLSPDGRRIAVNRTVNRNTDVWMLDLERGLFSRFTFDSAADSSPVWSPDGTRIAFNSNRSGVYDLYEKSATGVGTEQLLLATAQNKAPVDWSPDGRFVLYRSPGPTTGFDLWALPVAGDKKPFPVVQTDFEERDGQFSPDGKWVAYQSNESGRTEIIVQPFPGPGGKLQISTDGGAQVRWRADGRELFYIAPDGRLMAVPIRVASGQSVELGAPVPLFATRAGGSARGVNKQDYIVSLDGQRFLMNVAEEAASPIAVILNWKAKP